ncbi:MAG: hypothetical protein RQ758_03365 [Methanomicrobiaceae archaeon]|nr:hypothetical protein [Methanomicrobiaceae archaeon]
MEQEPIEIHLNRRGINSIEVPTKADVETGSTLKLNLINHGAPLHVTISSMNSALFTSFYHENLYVQDILEYAIPIKEDAYAGYFDIFIITGYGTKKATFRIFVEKGEREEPPIPTEELPEPKSSGEVAASAWLLLVLMVVAGISYGGWLFTEQALLNYIAFVSALAGVIVAWYTPR